MTNLWSNEEISILKAFEKDKFVSRNKLCACLPNRTFLAIQAKKKELKLKVRIKGNANQWTVSEDKIIESHYCFENSRAKLLNLLPNRNWRSISKRAIELGFKKKIKWTKEEDEMLMQVYHNSTDYLLQKSFPLRSLVAVKLRATKLMLSRGFKNVRKSNLSVLLEESPLAYYWTGFILADGHISSKTWRLALALANKDKDVITKFGLFIKCHNMFKVKKTQAVGIHAQDKSILPFYCKKFNIVSRKTYHPPTLDFITNPDLLVSLIIGYIDGDGCIKKSFNRKDFQICLKAHGSWLPVYVFFENKIYQFAKVKKETQFSRLNTKGYCTLCFSNTTVSKFLKTEAIRLGLPIMSRKWNVIDLQYYSRIETAKERWRNIQKLFTSGCSIKEIAVKLGLKYCCVYAQIMRHLAKDMSVNLSKY